MQEFDKERQAITKATQAQVRREALCSRFILPIHIPGSHCRCHEKQCVGMLLMGHLPYLP